MNDAGQGNRDYPWDDFSPEEYFKFNYLQFRDDDRNILEIVRDFFTETFSAKPLPRGARGIDVGTGANLYPTLIMLPFCESITLYEYSAANVDWLKRQRKESWPSWNEAWNQYWAHLCERLPYQEIADPRRRLSTCVEIVPGDVLELPARKPAAGWDVGTMFFVAESITARRQEFLDAVDHFFAMLKPDAPFAMAFMEHSEGYRVGCQKYPATDIGEDDVSACLGKRARDFSIHRLDAGKKPLREAYSGMIVAHGRVSHVR